MQTLVFREYGCCLCLLSQSERRVSPGFRIYQGQRRADMSELLVDNYGREDFDALVWYS